MLKLEDQLRTREMKIVWSREKKKKLLISLNSIIGERLFGHNLRNRKFKISINWKNNSIANRLATITIKEIETGRSKKN